MLTLILGGVRSGKSRFAQRLAAAHDDVLMLATAQAGDAEMAARIAAHQAERPASWRTCEEPLWLAWRLAQEAPAQVTLLDCATLWVSNLLLAPQASWTTAAAELEALLAWYHAQPGALIVVSNEVGQGIIPADPLSRTYEDWLGAFNQRLASAAAAVYLMVAGLPIELKALSVPGTTREETP